MNHLNLPMRLLVAGFLASIATFSSASDAPQRLVERNVEAEVTSSGGIRTRGAAVTIPNACNYRDHEVQILRRSR